MGFGPRLKRIEKFLTVSQFLNKFGIEVEPDGRIQCPVHDGGNKSSFHIKKDDRRWRCFSCGEYGGVVKLAKLLYKLDTFHDALIHLEESLGLIEDESPEGIKRQLELASHEDDPEIDRAAVFDTLKETINEIIIESKPRRSSLWNYYIMLIDTVDEFLQEFENNLQNLTDDGFYHHCIEILTYMKKFVPFYWGCVRHHLLISKQVEKSIRKMMSREYKDHQNQVRGRWYAIPKTVKS